MDFEAILRSVTEWLLTSGLRVAGILVLALVVVRVARSLAKRAFSSLQGDDDVEKKKRGDTLGGVVGYLIRFVVVVVAGLMILKEFGVEVGPVLAAAGVVGLAVGFGAQSMVKDFISGFFILLYDQIRVGDVVQVAGQGGLVEGLTLRMTRLRDLAGNVHFIPNGEIGVVTNMSKDFSRYVFDIGVAYREDVDEVMEVVRQIDAGLRQDPKFRDAILEPIEILGVDQFADSAVIVKARTKTVPLQQWNVAREFNRRMKRRFDELGIEIPFPHVTLYLGEDKSGRTQAVNVAMQGAGAGAR